VAPAVCAVRMTIVAALCEQESFVVFRIFVNYDFGRIEIHFILRDDDPGADRVAALPKDPDASCIIRIQPGLFATRPPQ